jgi:hypothetical protein
LTIDSKNTGGYQQSSQVNQSFGVPIAYGDVQGDLIFGGFNMEYDPSLDFVDQSGEMQPLSASDLRWLDQQSQQDAWQLPQPSYQGAGSYQHPSLGDIQHQQGHESLQPYRQASHRRPGAENWQDPQGHDWTQSGQQGDFQGDRWSGHYGDQNR